MYTIYSEKYKSWCVYKDTNTLESELIKSGFDSQEKAIKYMKENK
jgi:hypothetical protein